MRKKQQNKTKIAKNKTSFYLRIRQIRANLRQKEKVTKPQLALFIYLTWLTTIPAWDKRIFMEMRRTSGNRIRASARGHTQTITCQFFFLSRWARNIAYLLTFAIIVVGTMWPQFTDCQLRTKFPFGIGFGFRSFSVYTKAIRYSSEMSIE